jgi:hypothetical protein
MSLSKKDRKFPSPAADGDEDARRFAAAMAAALHETFGGGGSAVKTVARLTSVNERTVKNWFAGVNGPRGDHLVRLVGQSNGMLDAFLTMAGRGDLLAIARTADLAKRLSVILKFLDETLSER